MNSDPHFDLYAATRRTRRTGLLSFFPANTDLQDADPGLLWVRGTDSAGFLHGQLTNEVFALEPGTGNLCARTTRKGALVEWFSLYRLPVIAESEAFVLLLPCAAIKGLVEDLSAYRIGEAVEMLDRSNDYDRVMLQGPSSNSVLQSALSAMGRTGEVNLPEYAAQVITGKGASEDSLVFSRGLFGDTGFLLALPSGGEDAEAWEMALQDAAAAHGVVCLPPAEAEQVEEILRIEAGLPRMGIDAQRGGRLLSETGLDERVVSETKGCYLGQEIIAKLRNRGATARSLCGLILHGDRSVPELLANLPSLGSDLVSENGETIGTLVSRAYSPLRDAVIALAYLRRNWRAPGEHLRCMGKRWDFDAEVVSLPFYHAPTGSDRARWLYEEAISLFAGHRDDEAIAKLEECLRVDPSFAEAYEALGVLLGRVERYHEAIELFLRLEGVAPQEPMVHTNLSLFYMRLGEKEKAEEEKAKATVKQFTHFADRAQAEAAARGKAEQERENAVRKIAMFQEVLALDPDDSFALLGIGNAYSVLGEWSNAAEYLEHTCQLDAKNSVAHLAYGKALERLDRLTRAAEVYRQGMVIAARRGDWMPMKEMQHRLTLLEGRAPG